MRRKGKNTVIILLAVLLVGCVGGNKQTTDDFITVNLNANYPEKELILQNFMDVEYIALETSDEFITQGVVKAIGEKVILVTNYRDGNIFVFDRKTGKGLRKINRFGQGSEEYSQIAEIVLDEDKGEMFVRDHSARKILVYDLYGSFKRGFKFEDISYYIDIFNYDQDNLICYKSYSPRVESEQSCHILISKQDGRIAREIPITYEELETPVIMEGEMTIMPGFHLIVPNQGNWAFMRTSSDTIYNYLLDGNIMPLIARAPSIHAMNPKVFLFLNVLTDRYSFMQTMKKEVNFKTMKGFSGDDLVYDKQEKAVFKYTVYNDDFSIKKRVNLKSKPVNHEIVICESLEAHKLVEAYESRQLKGELAELAARLDEESNSVLMLIKHKK